KFSDPGVVKGTLGFGIKLSSAFELALKQLCGILFPGHCVPGLPRPLAGTVHPEGISDGLDAQATGTKMGTGAPVVGLTKPLKSPPIWAGVGMVTGLCPWAKRYLSMLKNQKVLFRPL